MPSRFEQYKLDESNKRNLNSDLQELQQLYNTYPEFYNEYSFEEFIDYANNNSQNTLDDSMSSYYNKKEDETKKLKELRKTTVPWLSETVGGSLAFNKFLLDKGAFGVVSKNLSNLLPNEQEIRRGTDRAFKNIGETVGLGDIWDEKIDKETGKKYYEIQEPETTAGQIIKPVGEIAASMAGTKGFGLIKSSKNIDNLLPKRKVGRPSKVDLAKQISKERTQRLLRTTKTLGRAELASQITFADDPDFMIVAGALSNYIGDDSSLLGDVFNYLDADEDSPETTRRLSLLLDGISFSSIVGAGIGTLKVTKETIKKYLNSIKNSTQSEKESFKSLLQGGTRTKSARQKNSELDVPIIKDIENEDILKFGKDSLIYKSLNSGYDRVQRFYRSFLTTNGVYSKEMFKMLKSADYNKIAWSKRASELHAKLVTSISKAAKNSKFSEKEIDDILFNYLTGKKTLRNLPKNSELRQFAKQSKDEIKALSKMLKDSTYLPPKLKKAIDANMGSYLRKTYQFYENKNWRPSQEVIEETTLAIAKTIQNSKQTKTLTLSQKKQASEIVDSILKRDDKNYNNIISHLNGVFGTKQNEIVFQSKKNILPAIQKLLGGDDVDSAMSVFRTIDTLGTQLTNYKLYDDLYTKGLGKWFFNQTGKFSKAPNEQLRLGTIQGKQFLQLDGLKTTPEISELFNTIEKQKGQWRNIATKAYGYFLTAKGSSQAAATVFNTLTHVRNTIGGSLILARNGINPFSNETIKSAEILSNDLFTLDPTKKKQALSSLYEEYQRLGLVNQNVRVGEFKNLINDLTNNANKNLYSYTNSLWKKTARKATSVYVAEDDLWRIVAYNKELNTLKKAYPNLSNTNLQNLKQEAADIVRATMPTYDLIPEGLQKLRMLPIGNFFSFTAEQFRNVGNTFLRAKAELSSGNRIIQNRGMERLAGATTTTYLGAKGVEDFSKFAFGISDEDSNAVRNLNLAPWSKNSSLLFSRDKNGNIQYIDLTYTDPTAPITDNFRNIYNIITDPTENLETVNKDILKQTIEGAEFFLRPFVSEALLTEAIGDILIRGGRTKEGFDVSPINPITKEPMVWIKETTNNNVLELINNLDIALYHIFETVLPREITDTASLIGGKKAKRIEEGKTTLQRELLGKFTGQRLITITPEKIKEDLGFKLRDLNSDRNLYQSNINKKIKTNVKAENVLLTYDEQNEKNYKSYVKGKLMLEAAQHFDIPLNTIKNLVYENLESYDRQGKDVFIFEPNEYVPLKISNEKLSEAYDKLNFSDFGYKRFYDSYTEKYLNWSQLPMLEPQPNVNKDRQQKVEGGLVSGPEVPDTKEDPADRVNPFTGSPYSDQMARLGLQDGGEVTDRIIEINNILKELGYSKEARAAKMGNIGVETGYTYDYQQKQKNGDGYGLYQLDFQKPFYNKYLENNKLKDSARNQIMFTHEVLKGNDKIMGMNTKDRQALQEAFKSKDVSFITQMFSEKYEKPGVPHLEKRIEEANRLYQLLEE